MSILFNKTYNYLQKPYPTKYFGFLLKLYHFGEEDGFRLSISKGNVVYDFKGNPVSGLGISWSNEELDSALLGAVSDIVFDTKGTSEVSALLDGVQGTDFNQSGIKRVLETVRPPENWRVGEAIGESYISTHRDCLFPWPDARDERKSGSSLPGADLVGFEFESHEARFAFGEVKTSTENQYPPGAFYGRTGLKQQLEDLRDKVDIRDTLVKYLMFRANNATWKDSYVSAFIRYNKSSTDVRLYGILIRDVPHNSEDLRIRVTKLNTNCPEDMRICLLAIYLPQGEIANLSSKIMENRNRGAE